MKWMNKVWAKLAAVGTTAALGGLGIQQAMVTDDAEQTGNLQPNTTVEAESNVPKPIPFADGGLDGSSQFTALQGSSEFSPGSPAGSEVIVRGNGEQPHVTVPPTAATTTPPSAPAGPTFSPPTFSPPVLGSESAATAVPNELRAGPSASIPAASAPGSGVQVSLNDAPAVAADASSATAPVQQAQVTFPAGNFPPSNFPAKAAPPTNNFPAPVAGGSVGPGPIAGAPTVVTQSSIPAPTPNQFSGGPPRVPNQFPAPTANVAAPNASTLPPPAATFPPPSAQGQNVTTPPGAVSNRFAVPAEAGQRLSQPATANAKSGFPSNTFQNGQRSIGNERFAANTAIGTRSNPNAVPAVGVPGDSSLEGRQQPHLVLQKIAPREVQVGKPAKFQVVVRNEGQTTANGVVVRDQVPKGTEFSNAAPQPDNTAGGSLTWQLGTLAPGEEKTIETEIVPREEGEIGSVATVSFEAQASARSVCTRPLLKVEMTGPPKVLIGQAVTFNIRLSNPGTGTASKVTLEEDVPEGLIHQAGRELEYEIGSLKPGETRDLELTLKADGAGLKRNVLAVHADGVAAVKETVDVEVIAPELQLEMNGPRMRYLQREATYTLNFGNSGTAKATNVELATFLPKGLKFVSTESQGAYDAQTHAVYWRIPEVGVGQKDAVKLKVMPVDTGEQKLLVQGSADLGIKRQLDKAVVVDSLAELFYTVSDTADPIETGSETVYVVTITNQGTKAATNVRLGARFPSSIKPLQGDGPSKISITQDGEGSIVAFDSVARMDPNSEIKFRIQANGLRQGDHIVEFQVISDESTTGVVKEEGTKIYADN